MKTLVLTFLLLSGLDSFCQELELDSLSVDSRQMDSLITETDSLLLTSPNTKIDTSLADFDSPQKKSKEFKGPLSMFAGNPGKAALYSLVLPGAGQLYNKKYWKVPFFILAEGVAIGVLINNSRIFNRWNNCLINSAYGPPGYCDFLGTRNQSEVKSERDQARQLRDYAIIGVTLVHLIQVADAFVNRHLIEFDVSDDLSFDIKTNELGPALGLTVTF